ncbi:MAG: DUF951 domain-containing protein [Oscillospiraceae bacterium]|nr:DUF951 domain-containing protein [Oscillospiraceae bacterium]
MRKPHPCGGAAWEVLRVGIDFRIRCLRCGRLAMLERRDFERKVKAAHTADAGVEGG